MVAACGVHGLNLLEIASDDLGQHALHLRLRFVGGRRDIALGSFSPRAQDAALGLLRRIAQHLVLQHIHGCQHLLLLIPRLLHHQIDSSMSWGSFVESMLFGFVGEDMKNQHLPQAWHDGVGSVVGLEAWVPVVDRAWSCVSSSRSPVRL